MKITQKEGQSASMATTYIVLHNLKQQPQKKFVFERKKKQQHIIWGGSIFNLVFTLFFEIVCDVFYLHCSTILHICQCPAATVEGNMFCTLYHAKTYKACNRIIMKNNPHFFKSKKQKVIESISCYFEEEYEMIFDVNWI